MFGLLSLCVHVVCRSNNDWGWRIFALPLLDSTDEINSIIEDHHSSTIVVRESEHPYAPNMDTYEKIRIPGARYLEIFFDEVKKFQILFSSE